MIFFLGRRIKNDSHYFHECVIEKFLRIQSLDQQIKIYEYFSFDNGAQKSLSFFIYFQTWHNYILDLSNMQDDCHI